MGRRGRGSWGERKKKEATAGPRLKIPVGKAIMETALVGRTGRGDSMGVLASNESNETTVVPKHEGEPLEKALKR